MPAPTTVVRITSLKITPTEIDLKATVGSTAIVRHLQNTPKDAWVWDQVNLAAMFFNTDGSPKTAGGMTLPWSAIPKGIQEIIERTPIGG